MSDGFKLFVYILVGFILFTGFGDHLLFGATENMSPYDGVLQAITYFLFLFIAELLTMLSPKGSIILSAVILVPFITYSFSRNIYVLYAVSIPFLLTAGWIFNQPIGNGNLTAFEASLIIAVPQLIWLIFFPKPKKKRI